MTEAFEHTDMVYALAQKGKVIYAAKASGLYQSDDGGKTWHNALASLGLDELAVTDILCFDHHILATTAGGILSSANGKEWQAIAFRKPLPTLSALAASTYFSQNKTLFAASLEDGLFRSEDAGKTWTAWNLGLFDLRVLSLNVNAHDEIYVGTETGLYLSKTSGRSWQALSLPFSTDAILSLLSLDDRLYVGTEHQGLYCYRNTVWEKLEPPKGAINKLIVLKNHELMVLINDALYLFKDSSFKAWKDISGISSITLVDNHEILLGFGQGDVKREKL